MNIGVSDLYFNHEKNEAELPPDHQGVWQGYDRQKLKENASYFCVMLQHAGIEPPSVDDLIADFESRF